jgi:16S rRNA (cytidine1402-2'-O)-methyltransferase
MNSPTTQRPEGSGTLFLVSTPIGNLDDISARAIEILRRVERIACEDTRHSGRLLKHLSIDARTVSLHDHNERQRTPELIADLEDGQSVALISDAGTPLLSDPGFHLVREAIARGIEVQPIPGASALLAALVSSGLPPYPFTFAGFPPPKSGKRKTFFERFRQLGHTLIFYESPHRLLRSLADAKEVFGDRPAAVARELTKLHEETVRGPLSELIASFEQRPSIKGELVVVLGSEGTSTTP